MSKRKYTKDEIIMPEIRAMITADKTQRETAEHFEIDSHYILGRLCTEKEAELAADIVPPKKGHPGRGAVPRDLISERAHKINRLKMGNELLQDFLQPVERKRSQR